MTRVTSLDGAAAAAAPRVPRDSDGVALFSEFFGDTAGFASAYAKFHPDLGKGLVIGPGAELRRSQASRPGGAPPARHRHGRAGARDLDRSGVDGVGRRAQEILPGPRPAGHALELPARHALLRLGRGDHARAVETSRAAGPPLFEALSRTTVDSPIGPIRLDRDRQGIIFSYLMKIDVAGGMPAIRTVRVVAGVDHRFGGYFGPSTPTPTVSRPGCHLATPPAWARD